MSAPAIIIAPPPAPHQPHPCTLTGPDGVTLLSPQCQRAFEDALDEVHTRFVINLPPEELATADRIFFQLEQGWWFYEDFLCDGQVAANVTAEELLPRFKQLKPFCEKMFQYSPLFQESDFPAMWLEFGKYKRTISTYGTILLNADCTKVLLVQIYNGDSWTLPAGKINQGENGMDAAVRETYEETGFDLYAQIGLTKEWKEKHELLAQELQSTGATELPPSPITWNIKLQGQDALSFMEPTGKRRTCYVCKGVPENFPFEAVARKEIGAIEWFDLDLLPKKTFAVLPFFGRLRGWIKKQQGKKKGRSGSKGRDKSNGRDKSTGRDKSNGRDKSSSRRSSRGGSNSRSGSANRVRADDPLVNAGLVAEGDVDRWTEEDMFQTNEQILGRKVDYDGNPHVFAEQGFGGNDPHAFRVVGGAFMNSDGTDAKSKMSSKDGGILDALMGSSLPSKQPNYQPLVASTTVSQLTPFFSEAGETPWGDLIEGAASSEPLPRERAGDALLAMLQGGGSLGAAATPLTPVAVTESGETKVDATEENLDVFTDAQITARSQDRHSGTAQEPSASPPSSTAASGQSWTRKDLQIQYEDDMAYIQNWVQKLPPTDFRIQNVDAIIETHFGTGY